MLNLDPILSNRYRGALFGLAVGDALGAPVEYTPAGTFPPIAGPRPGGPFQLPIGHWTDDTSLALLTAESLYVREGFDPSDLLTRYRRWYRQGYLSSTGQAFDIGETTREAIEAFENGPTQAETYIGEPQYVEGRFDGGDALTRVAPVVLLFGRWEEYRHLAVQKAGEVVRVTHGHPEVIDAGRYFGGLLAGALSGESLDGLLGGAIYQPYPDAWLARTLNERPGDSDLDERSFRARRRVAVLASGDRSFRSRMPPDITADNYVLPALEAALWAVWNYRSFPEAVLAAVNLGEQAPMVGALTGQLAGALYGYDAIPDDWRQKIALGSLILTRADGLLHLAQTGQKPAPPQPRVEAFQPTADSAPPSIPSSGGGVAAPVMSRTQLDTLAVAQEHADIEPGTVDINTNPDPETTPIGPGVPVLLWSTSRRKGDTYWQRGLVAVTEPVPNPKSGELIIWCAWAVEYAHAHQHGRPPRAEPWPARLAIVDPNPPKKERWQVPDDPPLPPDAKQMRHQH